MKKENQEILMNKYPELFTGNFTTGFQCRDGWFELLDNLFGSIYVYCGYKKLNEDFKRPTVKYLKEKFGSLSVMMDSADERIWGMIHFASYLSRKTCEFCGTTRNVDTTIGSWIYTCCELCHEKNERAKDLEWTPN